MLISHKHKFITIDIPKTATRSLCEELFANKTDEIVLRNIILDNECQSDYYTNQDNEIIVSHIAKFENLNKEFEFLCNQVNVNYSPLFHGNTSLIKSSYSNIYTKETIELVAEKEKNVIELTGYKY